MFTCSTLRLLSLCCMSLGVRRYGRAISYRRKPGRRVATARSQSCFRLKCNLATKFQVCLSSNSMVLIPEYPLTHIHNCSTRRHKMPRTPRAGARPPFFFTRLISIRVLVYLRVSLSATNLQCFRLCCWYRKLEQHKFHKNIFFKDFSLFHLTKSCSYTNF